METTLVGRATVCDVHESIFGNSVQVVFDQPATNPPPMPWLFVGWQSFTQGDVIVARKEGNNIKHYKQIGSQLSLLTRCRATRNPLADLCGN